MQNEIENPFAPPTSELNTGGTPKPRPMQCFLGVIAGVFTGALGFVAYGFLMNLLFLSSLIFLVITTAFLILFWRKRFKGSNRSADFSLGFLVTLTIFETLALLVMLLQSVPNDRKRHAGLTHRSTRTLQPRVGFSFKRLDFSPPSIGRLAAAPVNSIR